VWTIISIDGKEGYFYRGDLKEKAQVERISFSDSVIINKLAKEVHLANQKKDPIILTLKPTKEGGDWFYLNKVAESIGLSEQSGFVILNDKEKKWFGLHDYDFAPPEAVTVTTPGSVSTQKLPENNAIIIELKKDQTVWYTIVGAGFDSLSQQVKKPITENLKSVIADFEEKLPYVHKKYLIKTNNDANSPAFTGVIEALKQNNIFHYNLVTSLDQ
jgi:hypothetical protein